MSGDYRSKKELAHLLVPAVGRKVYDLGGNLEKGQLPSFYIYLSTRSIETHARYFTLAPTFKLIGNSIILGSLEVLAEAFTMGEKSNIGQDMVYQFIKGDLFIVSLMSCSNVHYVLRYRYDACTSVGTLGQLETACWLMCYL